MRLPNKHAKRFNISDCKVRNEETMLQVIEYLTCGMLLPVHNQDVSYATLSELLSLHDISVILQITSTE